MKKSILFLGILIGYNSFIMAQDPTVKIILNEEERYRFDSLRMTFVNPYFNVIIGDSAGMNDTAIIKTIENTFIGHKTGTFNQDSWNTFLGARAGENHVDGRNACYLGAWAGRYDSIGLNNTYIGADAGQKNKTGNYNTFVGWAAGAHSDSCIHNTFVGSMAGFSSKGGSNNVFLGINAGRNCGNYGDVYNNTYVGAEAGRNNEYGGANVFIGYQAGKDDTATWNRLIIANNDSTRLIDGRFDIPMIRFNAKWICAGFNNNVSIGDSAGAINQTGTMNTYVGTRAGIYDSAGRYNVAIGYLAGPVNTTGRLNAFVGTNAGFNNTTGRENVYLGTSAGGFNTIGNFNTCLGRRAGMKNQTGSGNVFLGYYSGYKEMGSNKLYVANDSTLTPLIYGEFDHELLKFHGETRIVDHDVYVTDSSKGIILTSPSGNCFRIKVNDAGWIGTEPVPCP
jgi:trimeric autotransporter adhesin